MKTRLFFFLTVFLLILSPVPVFAHQPRIVEHSPITVTDPEVSKAYYGELTGEPHVYRVSSSAPFDLYLNLLTPDIDDQTKDFSALMIKLYSPDSKPYATLDGTNFAWAKFWEPFGVDWYWKGPEFEKRAEAGDYEIRISNPTNRGKYTLAIGEIEAFDAKETWNALRLIPQLKSSFFEESPVNFILSPLGWGYILATYFLVLIVGLLAHFIVRKLYKKDRKKPLYHLAAEHRLLLAGFGICLLLLAIATSWHPALIFLSGVCLFEASGVSR